MHALSRCMSSAFVFLLILSVTSQTFAQSAPTVVNTTWQAELATFNPWWAKE